MLNYNFYESKTTSQRLLVMLHGFISDASTFDQHIKALTEKVAVLTIELPGHGQDQSDAAQTWNFDFIRDALDEVLAQFEPYQIYLHGYSMGGRAALYYALHGHQTLEGLILESTSPGIADEEDRASRKKVDEARAKVLEIAGLEVFVNDWEKLPLFASQADKMTKEERKRHREMRLAQDPKGLAKALRDYGTGQMPNLWPELSNLMLPVCFIVGERDEKFVEIAHKMKAAIEGSELHVVEEAGHTVHVEDAQQFDIIVLGFLNKEEQNG
ncbi:2-succinyl-6-hydroxy-2,4-cyclohexadiene-1-carboxylate synthase [Staphylococcus simulans]|uniref:2-succinyl-6-hydroxy-2, 4-cyclohexadiene-1-carboxylate synthase n=1 Tax=Staphylococcus simulans TaxID=1286 RepID=UPI001E62176B|nr:2-succinyl-6-hydroxy-2,4-cyclohexadiene-1-carboxylate synthase [Staphylococcus simulans]MCD8914417.1 2-succinyl-6-hydroxy-2,4-cyclohexadiene-1-carboxylate synthase [Staphylococcus simulans]